MNLKEILREMGANERILGNLSFPIFVGDSRINLFYGDSTKRDLELPSYYKDFITTDEVGRKKLILQDARMGNSYKASIIVGDNGSVGIFTELIRDVDALQGFKCIESDELNIWTKGDDIVTNKLSSTSTNYYMDATGERKLNARYDMFEKINNPTEVRKEYKSNGMQITEEEITTAGLATYKTPGENRFNPLGYDKYRYVRREANGYVAYAYCEKKDEAGNKVEVSGYVPLDIRSFLELNLNGKNSEIIFDDLVNRGQENLPIAMLDEGEKEFIIQRLPESMSAEVKKGFELPYSEEYFVPINLKNSEYSSTSTKK